MLGIAKMKPEKGVTLSEFPKPIPAEDEVLIKVKVSGICGSDVWLYTLEGPLSDPRLTLPIISSEGNFRYGFISFRNLPAQIT